MGALMRGTPYGLALIPNRDCNEREGDFLGRCIVCGIDSSDGARRAASVAAQIAHDLNSRVILAQVRIERSS